MKVLLSIKPDYANRILDGTKRYEFRRRVHQDVRVRTVIIYATKPIGKVVGEFSIKNVHSDHPDSLWEKTKEFSGITKEFFSDYFRGRDVGHAIEVKTVKRYKKPKDLSEFLASGVAPQSYAYVSA
ncbi:ASCH domain-containing protein [Allochromatium humboldtianum]|uniref:ASCH domain-containing protein n=1 Tax=Allochromatium humboldtianum TaxID=504901 RepID=A0A850RH84_9GAMM|nr:ASCH domain-containing protein [Allochromatium humboldtianum]NVZ11546.1 ASCH domain-containing protein [Allochromatium humboldtianum]